MGLDAPPLEIESGLNQARRLPATMPVRMRKVQGIWRAFRRDAMAIEDPRRRPLHAAAQAGNCSFWNGRGIRLVLFRQAPRSFARPQVIPPDSGFRLWLRNAPGGHVRSEIMNGLWAARNGVDSGDHWRMPPGMVCSLFD
jgi:hypothetical protein